MRNKLKIVSLLVACIVLFISIRSTIRKQYEPKVEGQNEKEVEKSPDTQDNEMYEGSSNEAYASWYGKSVCKPDTYGTTCKTASGEIFNEDEPTFAHRNLPFNTWVQFCIDSNCVLCRANDRGPYISGREFDLSLACFSQLAPTSRGVIKVSWQEVNSK